MAISPTNWLQSILFGYRIILANGVPVISRSEVNIVGLTVLDDPVNKRTNVTFAGANIPTDAPVANTIVSRNNAGGSSFTSISIYDDVPPLGVQTAYINGATGEMYADNGFSFQTETITRAQPYKPVYGSSWNVDSNGRITTTVNTAITAHFDLDIPDGAILTAVEIWIDPANAHAGLPQNKPAVVFNQIEIEDNNTSLLAGETDQSPDASSFDDPHAITLNASSTGALVPTVIDNTKYYYRVKFTSESGTNALLGCSILGIKATYETTEYRK